MHSPAPPDRHAETIAFIGGGNMARSLISGLLKRGRKPESIHVSEAHAPFRDALARDFKVHVHADNAVAAAEGALWLFAVKPQVLRQVAKELAAVAQARHPLVVSVAAGVTSMQLEQWLGGKLPVVRAMPNTPAQLGAGATGLFANAQVTASERTLTEELLGATGMTVWLDSEAQMDAVTALSGSGPAYVFLFAEAMQAAGVAEGLSPEAARVLSLQTIYGAARMLQETSESAGVLRQRVTSPGGTTQAAIAELDRGGFSPLIGRAIAAAAQRARELSTDNELIDP